MQKMYILIREYLEFIHFILHKLTELKSPIK